MSTYKPSRKVAGSGHYSNKVRLKDHEGRIHHLDSYSEAKHLMLTIATEDVTDIRAQSDEIRYMGADGREHGHHLDLGYVRIVSRERIGVIVRHKTSIERHGFEDLAERVAKASSGRYDFIRLWSPESMSQQRANYVRQIYCAKLERKERIDSVLRDALPVRDTTVDALCRKHGAGTFSAVLRAIADRLLHAPDDCPVNRHTVVRAT